MILMLLMACQSEDGCTKREKCEKKGGTWRIENCHTYPVTHWRDVSYDGGKTHTSIPYTTWHEECDEWCEGVPTLNPGGRQ